ncbi:thermonuclease family protein [Pedomonas sp. V897]|uniref:thermonuclease family protein n=1 Tax=Pedomonas sp. V897 TaxID=3446482 RepID=UPI003EE3C6CE
MTDRLTKGKRVICEWERRDHYGRPLARCTAAGVDLSCAMLASGHAAARYSKLECGR